MNTKLKNLIKSKGLTQQEVSELVGVSQSAVASWITGRGRPKHDSLTKLAKVLGVPIDFLNDSAPPLPGIKQIPVLDAIPPGPPAEATDYHHNEISMHEGLASTFDFGYLVQDNSMENAGILHLDIVFIQYEAPIEHGQIYLTTVEEKPILARIFIESDFYILKREYNQYKPILVNRKKPTGFRLVGKVAGLFRPDPIPYEDPD